MGCFRPCFARYVWTYDTNRERRLDFATSQGWARRASNRSSYLSFIRYPAILKLRQLYEHWYLARRKVGSAPQSVRFSCQGQRVMMTTLTGLAAAGAIRVDTTIPHLTHYTKITSVNAARSKSDIDAFITARPALQSQVTSVASMSANNQYHQKQTFSN